MEWNKENWMRMELPSLSENEEYARVAVAVFASRLDPTLEELNDIKTAVSEAVTNCIIHGYAGTKGIISIRLEISGTTLLTEIQDEGCGIADIKKAMEPMYTTDPQKERSGMGFSFMEAFMDSVEVWSEPGRGTKVTMKKRIGG